MIQKVASIVPSISRQFEAIGVHHHGLSAWKSTEPIARSANVTAITIYAHLACERWRMDPQRRATPWLGIHKELSSTCSVPLHLGIQIGADAELVGAPSNRPTGCP